MNDVTNPRIRSWVSEIDPATMAQAEMTARLDILAGPLALMPDAHYGIGSTVGSVIPTKSAIIPSAVGVDIGCGMIASETDITANQLPDDLRSLLSAIERTVPAGVGVGHKDASERAGQFMSATASGRFDTDLERKALLQFGTLGSGNHFAEVCLDERDRVWFVLHSGSRGVGNVLASRHIAVAKDLAEREGQMLEDPALAHFVEGTPEFVAYIEDMTWAQDYAMASRSAMMSAMAREILDIVGTGHVVSTINCHHNYATREVHNGSELWITRKGAIRAAQGDLGVIPGSMGSRSYIVRGLGNPLSWRSCSHGAGRSVGRKEARRRFDLDTFRAQMGDVVWLEDRAEELLDEIPSAYKDIDQVMANQKDLVEIVHTLHQVVNFKGS